MKKLSILLALLLAIAQLGTINVASASGDGEGNSDVEIPSNLEDMLDDDD